MFPYTTCLRFKRKTCASASEQAGSVDHKHGSNAEQPQSSSSNILRFRWKSKDKDETKARSNFLTGSIIKPKRPSKLPITKDVIPPIAASTEDSLITEEQPNAQAQRLSLGSMKFVDDTDTGTDILSELNALSEQIIETDTSTNLTPTIADVEPNRLTELAPSQPPSAVRLGLIGESASRDRAGKAADNRLLGPGDDLQTATLQASLDSNSLSRPTSALSVQSGSSSISTHQPIKPSYSNDLRHYQVKGPSAAIIHVPWNNSTVQSTAIGVQQPTASTSDTQFRYYSRPSSKLDYTIDQKANKFNNFYSTARQSLDLNEDDLKLSEKRDLRCADQTRCLLTLRRKAELRKRKASKDSSAVLDLAYYGVIKRFLLNSRNWNFNSFTLETLSGGHSLSQLLIFFFCKYDFIRIYNLDMTAVWKCFRLFENGYHDTNPYHNSVHAADVSQAMHCFIEQEKIKPYLTPLEIMCGLLAAVAHDLDHPGVNQHFLVATNSHLAALYQNLSVLESHHWRFGMSCIYESGIFAHFEPEQMSQVQNYLSSLILATDITQQQQYLQRFRSLLGYGRPRSSPSSTNLPSALSSPQHLIKSPAQADGAQQSIQALVPSAKTLAAPTLAGYYTSSGGQSPVRFVRTPSDKRRPFATIGSSLLEGTGSDLTSTLIKTTTAFTGTMQDALRLHVADNDLSSQPIDRYQLNLNDPEHRLFILQIALKCADLGNPCRFWPLSKQWTQAICTEFYRQGDFERNLNMQVSPICDRFTASMAQIQTEFFRNIVSPLFCLWHRFLNSKLSHKMICNLTFNNAQWLSTLGKAVGKRRHSVASCQAKEYRKIIDKQIESTLSGGSSIPSKQITASLSMSDLNEDDHPSIRKLFKRKGTLEWSKHFNLWLEDQRAFSDSIQLRHLSDVIINVIQPPDNQSSESDHFLGEDRNSIYQSSSSSNNQYPVLQHSSSFSNRQDTGQLADVPPGGHPLLSTSTGRIAENRNREHFELFALQSALSPLQTARLTERRGSAPSCIGICMVRYIQQNTVPSVGTNANNAGPISYPWKLSSRYQKRRSSFPVADYSQNCIQIAASKKTPPGKTGKGALTAGVTAVSSNSPVIRLTTTTGNYGQQFKELTVEKMKNLIQSGRHGWSLDSNAECKQWLINKPRRRSIPQEILNNELLLFNKR